MQLALPLEPVDAGRLLLELGSVVSGVHAAATQRREGWASMCRGRLLMLGFLGAWRGEPRLPWRHLPYRSGSRSLRRYSAKGDRVPPSAFSTFFLSLFNGIYKFNTKYYENSAPYSKAGLGGARAAHWAVG